MKGFRGGAASTAIPSQDSSRYEAEKWGLALQVGME